jgi:23S rRNA pseudouridine1911/1915/1917 synthase
MPLGRSGRRVYRRLGTTMNAEIKVMAIPEELAGQRLDQALARMFPEFSRSRLKSWLQSGAITVDGGSPRPRDAVIGGESVEFRVVAEVAVAAAPEPIALNVVYEDEALMVINKPVGLVVHPGAGNPGGTLMNGLLNHSGELEQLPRAGIVHRLDKETSGLLLIGKTLETHTALVRLLGEREISRYYLAVCNGVLTGGGTVDEPIGRHSVDRTRMCVRSDGKPAVTRYTVLQRFAAHTYISVSLETGRTHQIRVHMAHRRHALVGDPVYGGRLALPAGASDELAQMLRGFKRQALHATRLEFIHPLSGEELKLEAPPPADFAALLEVLRADAA